MNPVALGVHGGFRGAWGKGYPVLMDRHLTEEISITNLVDLDQLQRVQDQFSEATDLAIIAVDYRGNPVTQSHGFTPFCALMRMDPARRRLCHSCDAHGGLQAAIEGRPHIYRCHAGLVDFSVPITVGTQYVGAILCGQVQLAERNADPDFVLSGDDSWKSNRRLMLLLEEVPVASLRKMRAAADTLYGLSAELTKDEAGHQIVGAEPHLAPLRLAPRMAAPAVSPATAPEPPEGPDQAALWQAVDNDNLVAAHAVITTYLEWLFGSERYLARDRLRPAETVISEFAVEFAPPQRQQVEQLALRHRSRHAGLVNRYQALVHLETMLQALFEAIGSPRRRRNLDDLLNHIELNRSRALTLHEAAAYLAVSPSHLSKKFKAATGKIFVTYVTEKRVERARLMLACTEMPILKIAVELDFHQVNYFSRVFKASTGVSPTEYRREFSGHHDGGSRATIPGGHYDLLRA